MNTAPEKSEQEAIPGEFGTRALGATHRRCFSEPKQAFPPPSRRDEIPDAFPRLSHSSGRNRRGRVPQRQIRWFVQSFYWFMVWQLCASCEEPEIVRRIDAKVEKSSVFILFS